MGLAGSKNACEQGECGSCTVYWTGLPVLRLPVAAGQVGGAEVHRGGLARGAGGELHRCTGVLECGRAVRVLYAGLLVSTHDLLRRLPEPSAGDPGGAGRKSVSVHRYEKILDAVRSASGARIDPVEPPPVSWPNRGEAMSLVRAEGATW